MPPKEDIIKLSYLCVLARASLSPYFVLGYNFAASDRIVMQLAIGKVVPHIKMYSNVALKS